MFFSPKNLAPEPYFSAGHHVLYEVALFLRHARGVSNEQIADLGYAIHNLPASLIEHTGLLNEVTTRGIFSRYDEKWAKSPKDFSLLRSLDAGLERAKHRPQ